MPVAAAWKDVECAQSRFKSEEEEKVMEGLNVDQSPPFVKK